MVRRAAFDPLDRDKQRLRDCRDGADPSGHGPLLSKREDRLRQNERTLYNAIRASLRTAPRAVDPRNGNRR